MNGALHCATHLVSDFPADDDAFGAHDRVAAAVADVVVSEDGGRVIGLTGRWGAGKSTVIRLLAGHLRDNWPSVKVWVFDAWAHENDPLRRTFLEALIEQLTADGWVNTEAWTKKAEQLARRRIDTETKSYPRLSLAGWVALVLSLLVPVGAVLFAEGIESGALDPARLVNTETWVGFLLMLGPLWAVPLVIIWEIGSEGVASIRERRHYQHPKFKEALIPIVQGQVTHQRSETIQTIDPTSIEFQQMFEELIGEALRSHERKLVLVVDNLDRVSPEDALSLWSTLQTFLPPGDGPPWLRRLWIILPFDTVSIRRLWNQESAIAASFLDKTFQIRFEVPPTLLSDWRKYLIDVLAEALPDHSNEEFHAIYRLFALMHDGGHEPPTPRELKIVVNQIGALHRQWQDQFPLIHLAYYVLLSRAGTDILTGLLDGSIPRDRESGVLGDAVERNLAAIAYGAPQERAMQLLLGAPVARALTNGDGAELAKLHENSSGLIPVLESVLAKSIEEWTPAESENILHAIAALSEGGILDAVERHIRIDLLKQIYLAILQVESWTPLGDWAQPGLLALLRLDERKQYGTHALVAYRNALASAEPSDLPEVARGRAEAVLQVATTARGLGGYTSLAAFPFPGPLEHYPDAMEALSDRVASDADEWYLDLLCPTDDPDHIALYFTETISAGGFSLKHQLALSAVRRLVPGMNWSKVIVALRDQTLAAQTATPREVNALTAALLELRDDSIKDLRILASNGHFAHHIKMAATKKEYSCIARCLYAHLSVFPDIKQRGSEGDAQQGYATLAQYMDAPPREVVSASADLLIAYGTPDLPLMMYDHDPNTARFAAAVLSDLVARDPVAVFLTGEMVQQRVPLFQEHLDFLAMAQSWDNAGELAKLVREDDFDYRKAVLYTGLFSALPSEVDLIAWLIDSLQTVDETVWTQQLSEGGRCLQLALRLSQAGHHLSLTSAYRNALVKHAGACAAGTKSDALHRRDLSALLDHSELVVFRDLLLDIAKKHLGVMNDDYYEEFGHDLANAGRLRTEPAAITELLEPLVAVRHVHGLKRLSGALTDDPHLLSGHSSDYQKVFRRRLAEELRDGDEDEAHDVAKEIAQMLGVRKARKQSSTVDEVDSDGAAKVDEDGVAELD